MNIKKININLPQGCLSLARSLVLLSPLGRSMGAVLRWLGEGLDPEREPVSFFFFFCELEDVLFF